jgi:hypothetical protein
VGLFVAHLQTVLSKESEEPFFFYFISIVKKMDSPICSVSDEAVLYKMIGRASKKKMEKPKVKCQSLVSWVPWITGYRPTI